MRNMHKVYFLRKNEDSTIAHPQRELGTKAIQNVVRVLYLKNNGEASRKRIFKRQASEAASQRFVKNRQL